MELASFIASFQDNSYSIDQGSGCIQCGMDKFYSSEIGYIICGYCGTQQSRIEEETNLSIQSRIIQSLETRTILNASSIVGGRMMEIRHNIWEGSPSYMDKRMHENYDYLLERTSVIDNDLLSNKQMLVKTVNLYRMLLNFKRFRIPKKYGILGICYYYILKSFNILLDFDHIADILCINKKLLSVGNNIINKLYSKHKIIRNSINKDPITITTYADNIKIYMPHVSNEFAKDIKRLTRRYSNNRLVIKNVPKSVFVGLLVNYLKSKGTAININNLQNKFHISKSTIHKYTNFMKIYFL